MPDLQVPRMYLATCAQGTSIYAICGYGEDQQGGNKKVSFNTIECLKDAHMDARLLEDTEWIVIQVDDTALSPRNSPVAVAINPQEIAICGGYKDNEWYADMILYNTSSEKVKKIVKKDEEQSFSFFSYDNQCAVPY